MKAIQFDNFGEPSVLKSVDRDGSVNLNNSYK